MPFQSALRGSAQKVSRQRIDRRIPTTRDVFDRWCESTSRIDGAGVLTLNLIGAPSSAGAYAPGQEKAPAAFRQHGLADALIQAGRDVRDGGDVAGIRWRPDPTRLKAMNVEAVRRTAGEVAVLVADAMATDEAVLVLGGDCTVEL